MATTSPRQKKTVGRVMHEYAHGELKSGQSGKGGKVKSRKQAIAIALNEAGASQFESKNENKRSLAKSKRKEASGQTAQQEKEGKSRVGASGKRESSKAMGGENATARTERGKKTARSRARGGATKEALYNKAKREKIPNRSKMTKGQLENAVD